MLKTKGSMTVGEMSVELGITEMAVRRHLSTLERDDLIKSRLLRQSMGRPTNVYYLSEEAENMFPKNYGDLSLELLKDVEELQGEHVVEELFRRRKERMEESYQDLITHDSDMESKLEALARLQNDKGYMVEVKKDEDTGKYIFVESNCPISNVAREYNVACDCEKDLFKTVLKADVNQEQCMATGGDNCVYIIEDGKKDTKEKQELEEENE